MGIIANIRVQHETAMQNYEKALAIYQKYETRNQDQARIYHNIGMTLSDQGNFTEAIKAFESCLELSDKVEDKQLNALTHLNMGKTYIHINNLPKAKKLTDKALKIFKRTGDALNVAEGFHILGMISDLNHEDEIATEYFNRSIKINLELNCKEGLAESYYALAGVFNKKEDISLAIDFYCKSLEIFKELNVDLKIKEVEQHIHALASNSGAQVTVVEA